ncbi:1518_t:CDS:2 [Acaulospora morrowiae]|uniref:1518_t:CDS:1 n=1 Tax=Acaulospora morrowiae TaxID=94023 RepID=A0A9N8WAN8_9GLOM|nr:1518_t:CDS:2 [Acaulospora morrowiae]
MGNTSSVSAENCGPSLTTRCPNTTPTRHSTKYRIIGNGRVVYPLPNSAEEEKIKNINGSICERLAEMLLSTREISGNNFSHEVVISPVGRWGKRAGEFGLACFRELSRKMKSDITAHLGITEQEYDKIIRNSEMEFDVHRSYTTSHRFIGQKIF